MKCEQFEHRLNEAFDERSALSDQNDLRGHAEECSACQATLAAAMLVEEACRSAREENAADNLPAGFSDRVVQQYLSVPVELAHRHSKRSRVSPVLVASLAGMLLLAMLPLFVWTVNPQSRVSFSSDRFQRPYPFRADIAVDIGSVFEQKVDALLALESQTFEGGALGSAERMAEAPPASRPELRRAWLRERWVDRQSREAHNHQAALQRWYGSAAGDVQYAEAFEICEYGRQPSPDEIRKLFPFLPAKDDASSP